MPVPGDEETRGTSRPYRAFHLALTEPTLPVRFKFPNALPAVFAQRVIGQARNVEPVRWPYRGLTIPALFPTLRKGRPWE